MHILFGKHFTLNSERCAKAALCQPSSRHCQSHKHRDDGSLPADNPLSLTCDLSQCDVTCWCLKGCVHRKKNTKTGTHTHTRGTSCSRRRVINMERERERNQRETELKLHLALTTRSCRKLTAAHMFLSYCS